MQRNCLCLLAVLAILLCGCIGSGTPDDLDLSVIAPLEQSLACEPYCQITFEVEAIGVSDDQIRWYVDDVYMAYGTSFSYMPDTEGSLVVKVVADNGDDTIVRSWDLRSEIDVAALMAEVSALRGLDFESTVPFETMTRGELQGYLLEDLQENKESIDISQKIFEALYAWSGRSLYEDMFTLYTGNIEGLYDFEEKVFYTISDDGKPPIAKKLTMAHELVHVLQDQSYSISEMEDIAMDDDQLLAIQCVLEGDATTYETAYLSTLTLEEINALYAYYMSMDDMDLDPFVASFAYFPYIYGERFVSGAIEAYGAGYLDTIYANVPASTEQVLHPEKYYANEAPLEISSPHRPDGMESLEENTLGEGMLLIVLTQHLPYETAEPACEGWGGDHYGYYESDAGYAFVYDAVWDTPQDAAEWYVAMGQYLLEASGKATPPNSQEAWIFDKGKTIYISRSSVRTTMIISSDEEIIRGMLQ